MKRYLLLTAIIPVLIIGCNPEENGCSNTESIESAEPIAVILPGDVIEPAGDTVTIPPATDVLLYFWLPMDKFEAMENDLLFLASADSTILILPVQPDNDSRNYAQSVVNNLEISLPVYLADSMLMDVFDMNILPACVLFTQEGEVYSENGFGAPARILESHQTGE